MEEIPFENTKLKQKKQHAHSDFRKKLLQTYGHQCMVCGYSDFVEAHHIEPRSESHDNSLKNGILLCPNHHREADYGLIDKKLLLDIAKKYPKLKEPLFIPKKRK